MADDILKNPPEGVVVEGDKVTITMKNGMAVYREEADLGQARDTTFRIYELVENIYEPAPKAEGQLPL